MCAECEHDLVELSGVRVPGRRGAARRHWAGHTPLQGCWLGPLCKPSAGSWSASGVLLTCLNWPESGLSGSGHSLVLVWRQETLCSCNRCEVKVRGLETSGGVPRPGLGPHPRQHGREHHGDGDSLGRAERGSHVGKTTWEVAGTMNGADFGG